MTEDPPVRPQPIIDADSGQFWEFLREHRMHVPRCRTCRATFLYPRSLCPRCAAEDLEWVPVSGRGTVWSWTVSRRSASPAFSSWLPLVVALVELAEGPRLLTNLIDVDPADVRIGLRVELVHLDLPETTVPLFRPAGTSTSHPTTDGEPS